MNTVIIQIIGKGAFRVPVESVPAHQLRVHEANGEFYVVDGCGRTWAPLPDGEYCLWEDNETPCVVSSEVSPTIVKLSCGCSAATPFPGFELRDSMDCRDHGIQRIIVIEADEPIIKNHTHGAGPSVKCEYCGTLFSGDAPYCPSCVKGFDIEFEMEAQAYAVAHGEEF